MYLLFIFRVLGAASENVIKLQNTNLQPGSCQSENHNQAEKKEKCPRHETELPLDIGLHILEFTDMIAGKGFTLHLRENACRDVLFLPHGPLLNQNS